MDGELDRLIRVCFENPTDEDTLTSFYDGFRPYVLAILISLGREGASLSEDAYQSAFLKYMSIFVAGKDRRIDYVPYFVAIAKHGLIDEQRRQRRHVPIDDLLEGDVAGLGPDETLRRDARLALLEAIPRLGHKCHAVLERYYVAGIGVAELAGFLGIAENSVYVVLQRCREELKSLISGR